MKTTSTRREEAVVGLFVLIAAGLLIVTVFSLTGFFNRGDVLYRAFFRNAGGLRPGAEVHYAGGPPVGRVEDVHSDAHDTTRMEITFRVKPDVPIKTDSVAAISSTSPLSDNFLGILPGTNAAQRAPAGYTLKSKEYVGIDELESEIADLGPEAKVALASLNQRLTELQVTVARVNDVLNDKNRDNLSASLGNVRGVLEENRKPLHSTVMHFDEASAKIAPLLDDLKKTNADAQKTINTLEGTISENRGDLRKSIEELRHVLDTANNVTDQLDRTLNANGENIDDILNNFRQASQNLRQFTETLKQRPYTLLRSALPPAHVPGQKSKPE
ncbi:MAG TPA: MlaD family protein [Candidatus Acidoferrum sp.]|jgi:phospholipid/cholesterol/gamma-HCH transport system substrate-binding protein